MVQTIWRFRKLAMVDAVSMADFVTIFRWGSDPFPNGPDLEVAMITAKKRMKWLFHAHMKLITIVAHLGWHQS